MSGFRVGDYRTCCCTGYMTNPGGRCCMDMNQWDDLVLRIQPVKTIDFQDFIDRAVAEAVEKALREAKDNS